MSKLIDLTGQQFGYWKVLHRAENNKDGQARWTCLCTACGKIKEVSGAHLRGGRSTNCGCVRLKKMVAATMKDETGKTHSKVLVIAEHIEYKPQSFQQQTESATTQPEKVPEAVAF